ncbi:MAG: hypothetical protein ACREQI_12200 [Candidatus Binataceae bacterium]
MDEKLGYPVTVQLSHDTTVRNFLSGVFISIAAANKLSIMLDYELPPTGKQLRPDLLGRSPILWSEVRREKLLTRHLIGRWPGANGLVRIYQEEEPDRVLGVTVAARNLAGCGKMAE